MKLDDFLNQRQVPFERLEHPTAFTASRIAKVLHVPGQEVAKTVLLHVDDVYVLVVLPATHHVDLQRVRQQLGATRVELASEAEMQRVCPDCEPGAIPPFGSLYHLTTLVDETLAEDEEIVFESQSHHEAIRMAYRDFQEQEHPRLGHFATNQLEELVQKYTDRLIQRIRKQLPDRLRQRIDPEDVVQAAYRCLLRRLKDQPQAFEDSQRIGRMLTVIAYHKVRALVNYHQQARRDVRKDLPESAAARVCRDAEPGPDEQASFDDLLDHYLRDLPANERQMVALRLQGADIDDIARRCNCPRSTVRQLLARVQESLRKELETAE